MTVNLFEVTASEMAPGYSGQGTSGSGCANASGIGANFRGLAPNNPPQDSNGSSSFTLGTAGAGYPMYATGCLGGYTPTPATSPPTPSECDLYTGANGGSFYAPSGRHSGGSNFLMFDGHVKWLNGANVSPGVRAARPSNQENPVSQGCGTAAGTAVSTLPDGAPMAATFSTM